MFEKHFLRTHFHLHCVFAANKQSYLYSRNNAFFTRFRRLIFQRNKLRLKFLRTGMHKNKSGNSSIKLSSSKYVFCIFMANSAKLAHHQPSQFVRIVLFMWRFRRSDCAVTNTRIAKRVPCTSITQTAAAQTITTAVACETRAHFKHVDIYDAFKSKWRMLSRKTLRRSVMPAEGYFESSSRRQSAPHHHSHFTLLPQPIQNCNANRGENESGLLYFECNKLCFYMHQTSNWIYTPPNPHVVVVFERKIFMRLELQFLFLQISWVGSRQPATHFHEIYIYIFGYKFPVT